MQHIYSLNERPILGLNRRELFLTGVATALALLPGVTQGGTTALPMPRYNKLPRWRGFNLLEKFMVFSNERFREDDFRNIHDLGFDFVRLPMDYRCWTLDKDWRKIDEQCIDEIEEAITLGEKYGIHVCLNFHRAPGWTVAKPTEEKSLWTTEEALDVCCQHWNHFARRFKKYGNEQLSFNLFNEPAEVETNDYVRVVQAVTDAIRAESSQRLIICDGLDYGCTPSRDILPLKVAQSTRGYLPFELTHYKANWVDSVAFPEPQWPKTNGNGFLPSPHKDKIADVCKEPLLINGPFNRPMMLRYRVGIVSSRADLVIQADGKEIYRKDFVPGPGEGEWIEVVFRPEWQTYQNLYNRDYFVEIPAGIGQISIQNVGGDWMTISQLGIVPSPNAKEVVVNQGIDWKSRPSILNYSEDNGVVRFNSTELYDRKALWNDTIVPWLDAEKEGIGVMVGEFGAYNKTPHQVVLAWMEDVLRNWQEANWGWALWNFRGGIGVCNSGREDVDYESWRGLALDRKMLDLLQNY